MTLSIKAGLTALAVSAALWAAPAPGPGAGAARAASDGLPGAAEGARFAPALAAAETGDWAAAESLAARVPDPAARDAIRWLRLLDGDGEWADYADFLTRHPDWPSRTRLRREAERRMPPDLPDAAVLAFFDEDAPQTGGGALLLADALKRIGRVAQARDAAIRAWRELSLAPSEQAALAERWGGALRGHHAARLDMLLWRGLSGEAMRMAPHVDAGRITLARARLALRRKAKGVDALVAAVPRPLASDPGLAYERFRWRDARGLDDSAEELLLAVSSSAEALGRPEIWGARRAKFARRALREGRARDAYRIAARNFMTEGSSYADLEWLAGWIALRKLDDPKTALRHFERFSAAVETPISLGRAGYWIGRAREAMGDAAGARAAYAQGARHQTSFYGQLAAEKIGASPDDALAGTGPVPDWRRAPWLRGSVIRAGMLAQAAGDQRLAHRLLTGAALSAPTPRDLEALGQLALDLDRPDIAVRVAKIAARRGVVTPTSYYPVTALGGYGAGVHPALALSIARQESELNPLAVSRAGARGLMQLMPATARKVARELGIGYSKDALTGDWRYNARLGQTYLAGLIAEFGSEPMAAAGYNAGPRRVRGWIDRFGDPRTGAIDMVDWIEMIPFDETRNYVMRVMEGLHVYHARLSGKATPIRLSARLSGR